MTRNCANWSGKKRRPFREWLPTSCCRGRARVIELAPRGHWQIVVHAIELAAQLDAKSAVVEIDHMLADGKRVVLRDGRQPGRQPAIADLTLADVIRARPGAGPRTGSCRKRW